MITSIKPWGNSQGLYIPKEFLKQLGLGLHDKVEMFVDGNQIIIKKGDGLEEKRKALEELQKYRMNGVKRDYREEMNEYLDERYGNV
ncbi:MAG: AbrB/MazE/SpoVT family DNA-binding domain-containing protein [Clostridia bacterium]|nr:AbrB/MazE/SpoVT family DNA-binding domain-containing protein [Clostridia bacterium]